jgi:hypothetical protein
VTTKLYCSGSQPFCSRQTKVQKNFGGTLIAENYFEELRKGLFLQIFAKISSFLSKKFSKSKDQKSFSAHLKVTHVEKHCFTVSDSLVKIIAF